jgi:hypothetical protein
LHANSDCRWDKPVIAKVSVCRINPNPPCAREIDFNPRVQTTLRATIFDIHVKLAQESADNPNSQTDFPQNRRTQ